MWQNEDSFKGICLAKQVSSFVSKEAKNLQILHHHLFDNYKHEGLAYLLYLPLSL